RPVIVVVDVVLGLVAQAEAEKETTADAPVVLQEERAVEEKNARQRIFNHGGGIERGRASLVSRDVGEIVAAVGSRGGVIGIAVSACTCTKAQGVRPEGCGPIVLQHENILM